MAGLNKKEFAKKDMNFFSEFTKSSQAFAKAAGIIVIVSIAVVAAVILFCVFRGITYGILNKQVKEYNDKFNSPEYVNLKVEAQALAEKSANINKYGYVMQTMKTNAEKDTGVEFSIVTNIEEHIPSNIILTSYAIDKGVVRITGESHTKYAPTEMVNMLKESTIFVGGGTLSVERVDPSTIADSDKFVTNYINAKYNFAFEGKLVADCSVKVSYLTGSSTLLKDLETDWVKSGDSYTVEDIARLSVGGKTYELSAIYVNGAAISADRLNAAKLASETYPNGSYNTTVSNDVSINLYYSEVATNTEAGN